MSPRKSSAHPGIATQVGCSFRMLGRAGYMFLGVMNLTNHDVLAVSRPETQRILKAVGFQLVLLARVWQRCVGLPQAHTG